MKSQKLSEDRRIKTSLIENPKTETSNQIAEKVPAQNSQTLSFPLRLELAGNRLSPLHEW